MTYYTNYKRLLHLYDCNNRKLGYASTNTKEHSLWEEELRTKLVDLIGINKLTPGSLKCELLEIVSFDGYERKKYILETEEDVWMPFYQLIPCRNNTDETYIPVIALHGHGGLAKEGVAGAYGEDGKESIERYHCSYGLDLVKAGFMVFCPDARGSGERREFLNQGDTIGKQLESSCNSLNFTAMSLGYTLTGWWTWDLMKLVDYVTTLKDCNLGELSTVGFSGGGLQALWLSALDKRIMNTVISGYYHSYRDTILRTNQCGCNFVPNLYEYADIGDIGALIAPRKLLIESGNMDHLNGERGIKDVIEQVDITKEAYVVKDSLHKFQHVIYDGGHRWYGENVISFLTNE
jgi:hypothetical protein